MTQSGKTNRGRIIQILEGRLDEYRQAHGLPIGGQDEAIGEQVDDEGHAESAGDDAADDDDDGVVVVIDEAAEVDEDGATAAAETDATAVPVEAGTAAEDDAPVDIYRYVLEELPDVLDDLVEQIDDIAGQAMEPEAAMEALGRIAIKIEILREAEEAIGRSAGIEEGWLPIPVNLTGIGPVARNRQMQISNKMTWRRDSNALPLVHRQGRSRGFAYPFAGRFVGRTGPICPCPNSSRRRGGCTCAVRNGRPRGVSQ